MSITTKAGFVQPALIGGAVVGTLSALPIISAGNLCCCLWVVCGGSVAAYVLQQNQEAPVTPVDGAVAGVLAGVAGAFVYLLLSIPISIVMAPFERVLIDRIIDSGGDIPPEVRQYLGSGLGTGLKVAFGFLFMLVVGSMFATIGGVVGAMIFKKKPLPPVFPDTTGTGGFGGLGAPPAPPA